MQNDSVRQIVENNLGSLREAVEQHNIKLTSIEVTVDQDKQFAAGKNDNDNQFGKSGSRKEKDSENSKNHNKQEQKQDMNMDTGRRLGYNSIELVA